MKKNSFISEISCKRSYLKQYFTLHKHVHTDENSRVCCVCFEDTVISDSLNGPLGKEQTFISMV